MPLQLSIVTPEGTLVELAVGSVLAPGGEGEFGVLPAHEPYLTSLQAGELRYVVDGKTFHVAVSGGFAEVTQERVTILAPTAEPREDIDPARARAAQARASEALRNAEGGKGPDETAALREELARAEARLKVAERERPA